MRLLIDADGCPVVKISAQVAAEWGIETIALCDTAHQMNQDGLRTIVIDRGNDAVDFAIVNLLNPGDLVVTQDYGLAAMALARGGLAIRQDGLEYTSENIDALLLSRHTAKKIRMAGGRLKGNPKRTAAEDDNFAQALRQLLGRMTGKKGN